VVLPVHRQADHIASVVVRLHGAIASISSAIEMILVVNGADDGSFDRCREAAGTLDGVSVLRVAEPGWGRAVRTGLAHSTGQLLCFSNSARTSPEDLRTALALGLLNEGHAVKATRRSRDSVVRRSASVVYNLEARALFGLASWDINGTPKVFPRSFTPLLELQEPGDLLDLEWLVACRRHDLPLIEFPVTAARRHGGVSTTKVRSAVGMYAGALRLRRRLAARPAEPERG
jgi:glycosyltransferase involved in cell wall biosynthesis